jgi:hypothetical protein
MAVPPRFGKYSKSLRIHTWLPRARARTGIRKKTTLAAASPTAGNSTMEGPDRSRPASRFRARVPVNSSVGSRCLPVGKCARSEPTLGLKNSAIGCNGTIRSQIIFKLVSIGTATRAPTTPHPAEHDGHDKYGNGTERHSSANHKGHDAFSKSSSTRNESREPPEPARGCRR